MSEHRFKPTVAELLPFVRQLSDRSGCCLHIVLDDDNVEDDHVWHCVDRAEQRGHDRCLMIGLAMLGMSKTQRYKLGNGMYK